MPGGVDGQSRLDSPHPIFMARAEGAYIEDVDGNRYVDFHCGFGSVLLGHNDPRIRETIAETLAQSGVHFATAHPLEMELAGRLQRALPSAERDGVRVHGNRGDVSRGPTGARAYQPSTRGQVRRQLPRLARLSLLERSISIPPTRVPSNIRSQLRSRRGWVRRRSRRSSRANTTTSNSFESLFANHAADIAAIIVEPIFHNGGAVMPAPGFLETCRELCSQYGSVLIFDEVITGFRQSMGGAQTLFGVTPDLTTLGKAMANGFPISVLAGRSEVMEDLSPLGPSYFSGTFNGHVLNVAVANRCCEILESEPPYESLSALGSCSAPGN